MLPQIYVVHSKHIRNLYKICKSHLGEPVQQSVREKFSKIIHNINNYHEDYLFPDLPDIWDSDWMDSCIKKWQAFNNKAKSIRLHNELKNINKCINERAEIIQSNQKAMLNSILNRYREKIQVDRLV